MFFYNCKERVERTRKQKELGEVRKKNGSAKCGNNPFSKTIIIDNKKYDCWSEAIEKLKMSKFKIKNRYKIEYEKHK